ncbi:MAG TPA: hypothetical protein VHR37_04850, partial [Solirubrobacterales bacterium]|nr:hypothetical protein [Solirubrobacterales bacterium]
LEQSGGRLGRRELVVDVEAADIGLDGHLGVCSLFASRRRAGLRAVDSAFTSLLAGYLLDVSYSAAKAE